MDHFDLIVIGGGAGAFAAAIKANELGAKTAVINAGLPLGGTCVNVGCVPSKTLLFGGETLHSAKRKAPGLELEVAKFNFRSIIKNEISLVEKLRREKYEKVLSGLNTVTFIKGKAEFISPTEVTVSGRTLQGKKFIIATGSTTTIPPIEGIRETGFITHIEALQLTRPPGELAIIGGGPLGLEYAQMYSRFGSRVTVLQRGSAILPKAETVLSHKLQEILEEEGIAFRTNVKVEAVRTQKGKKIISYLVDDKRCDLPCHEILLASGKTPNTQALNLAEAGVKVDGKLAVRVNRFFQTSQQHIYAIGDVANLPLRLEPTAGHEGTLAAENALTGSRKKIDYLSVPSIVFTDPQLAAVGLTEDEQMRKMGVCACRTIPLSAVPKAVIQARTEGLIKMVIHPQTGRIMGMHILAPQAGELIATAMVLVKNRSTVMDIIDSLPGFPTFSEAIKLAALSFTKDISKLSCCI